MNKKAQGWGIDLVVASTIFIFGIMLFYIYSINFTGETEDVFNSLHYDGKIISDSFLSAGVPENWTSGDVIKIGVMDGGEISELKLSEFYNLTQDDYPSTKELFRTKYDYYFSFGRNLSVYSDEISGVGKPGTDIESLSPENLVKITRFSSYKNKPVTVDLYIWQE